METTASKRSELTSNVQIPSTSRSIIPPPLPQEIIFLILSKLPVKSLLRFRCVSKPWLALISSSEFIKTHLHSSANDKEYRRSRVLLSFRYNYLKDCSLRSLLYSPMTEAFDPDFPMSKSQTAWCVGSANGLICLNIGLMCIPFDMYLEPIN
ncbi:hypothetical protein A4A49_11869 [Nicotiana attenuata]|uniref:F-box domain-containing protein n=1 Tax=Nicotiana attenuata TaxID=49451 RepID=A0A314KTG9_NICAT|nr:hypothetical protein A4A49_11869 [Nicotiana attenuata]